MKPNKISLRRWPSRIAYLSAALSMSCGGGSSDGQPRKVCPESAVREPLTLPTSARLLLTQSLVSKLQARAAAKESSWLALAKQCDGYATGTVHPPSGNAYPSSTSVGQGYQGDGYLAAISTLGLCYRTTKGVDDAAALKYAAAGGKVLEAMSMPANVGGAKPSTDSGYGIRNYGVGMALGYDWLEPDLSAAQKAQVVAALNTWIDWYDQNGFTKNDPIANYFVGYFLAKTYTAIATEKANPKAAAYWNDVETHLWGQLVKPKYSAYMSGGGWPEGWQYGPRAVRGIAECLWGVKTGKNLSWHTQLPQGPQQAQYLNYFVWPSFERIDDQGTVRAGAKLTPSATLYTSLATILGELGDPAASIARAVAADVLATGNDDRDPWQKFLYWDAAQPSATYKTRPLSYAAYGPGHVAMRSTWDSNASWGAMSAGRYIGSQDSGEQMFNAGGLSIVAGANPVLVNATGWIPQTAGTAGEDFVYADSWGGSGRRLYNTFFVDNPGGVISPGQNSASPASSKAQLARFEDGGTYVRVSAANLEDQYGSASNHPVKAYQRDLVYLRPGTFVLFDRTVVASASADRWMAFHTPVAPSAASVSDATQRRFDVSSAGVVRGSLRLLLPQSPQVKLVTLPGGTTRIEAHATGSPEQKWLSVVTTGVVVPEQSRLTSSNGNAVGVAVHAAREQVVLFPADQSVNATLSSVVYTVPAGTDADHVIVDVQPSATGYAVTALPVGSSFSLSVSPGGGFQASKAGVLAFTLTKGGSVTSGASSTPPGGGSGGAAGGTGAGGSTNTGGSSGAAGSSDAGMGAGGDAGGGGSQGVAGGANGGGSAAAGVGGAGGVQAATSRCD